MFYTGQGREQKVRESCRGELKGRGEGAHVMGIPLALLEHCLRLTQCCHGKGSCGWSYCHYYPSQATSLSVFSPPHRGGDCMYLQASWRMLPLSPGPSLTLRVSLPFSGLLFPVLMCRGWTRWSIMTLFGESVTLLPRLSFPRGNPDQSSGLEDVKAYPLLRTPRVYATTQLLLCSAGLGPLEGASGHFLLPPASGSLAAVGKMPMTSRKPSLHWVRWSPWLCVSELLSP